jgi:hypothetical protein
MRRDRNLDAFDRLVVPVDQIFGNPRAAAGAEHIVASAVFNNRDIAEADAPRRTVSGRRFDR